MKRLTSDITIGAYRFSGVHEVRINRSLHTITDKAYITIPSIANVLQGNKTIQHVTTGTLFAAGDPVTINLGYDGINNTEFEGFVSKPGLNMPLEIECEGYSRQLRLNNNITKKYSTTTMKALLDLAIQNTDITLEVPEDMPMADMHLTNTTGADICEYVKRASEHVMTVFFKDYKTLWAGLVYTPYSRGTDPLKLGNVNYRLGYNCIKDNSLKVRTAADNQIQIIFGYKLPTGRTIFTTSQLKSAKAQLKRMLKHVPSEAWLESLAQEKEYHNNYVGYEGKLTTFLQPFAIPGMTAYITDSRYPDNDGTYLIESTEVRFGVSGARRHIEIGPKIGFTTNG